MKRSRSRGRRQGNPANRSYDSNGPDMKVRGNASTVYEKYLTLARDALTAGDPVKAENLFQHAEHYCRVMTANAPTNSVGAGRGDDDAEAASFNGGGMSEAGVVEPLVLGNQDDNSAGESADGAAKKSGAKTAKGDKRRRGPLRGRRKDAGGAGAGAGDKAASDEASDGAGDEADEASKKDAATA